VNLRVFAVSKEPEQTGRGNSSTAIFRNTGKFYKSLTPPYLCGHISVEKSFNQGFKTNKQKQ